MKRHSSPYTVPVLLGLGLLLTARLARANEVSTLPPAPDTASFVGAQAPAAAAPAEAKPQEKKEAAKDEISEVRLQDGQTLRGRLISRDDNNATLELVGGSHITVASNAIQSVTVEKGATIKDGEVWQSDRNRTRYLYAPSAMMLKQGEGYVSQKELLFTSASVGVTDNLSLLAGAALPVWAVGGGFHFIFAAKAGFSIGDNLHLAGGAESLVLPGLAGTSGVAGAGFIFGTVTVGNPSTHASLSVGRPFAFVTNGSSPNLGDVIIVASGNLRLSQRFGLVTENWIFPTLKVSSQDALPFMLNALSARFLLDRWTLDVGAVRVHTIPFPVPWLDVAYSWG